MKKRAFSLIELAVVLVVIGLLAAAITKGSSLLHASRIASAKSLTAASRISEIDGLVTWYENVLPDSFDKDSTTDNAQVAYWQDVSSQYNITESKNRLTRTASSSVVYRKSGIGNLPSLQFTSSGNFTLTELIDGNSKEFSVFAVLSPTLAFGGATMTFIDSYDTSDNAFSLQDAAFSIESGTTKTDAYDFVTGSEYVVAVTGTDGIARIFVNNNTELSDVSVDINGFSGLTVGTDRGGADKFTGLISEIIIFNRVLTTEERRHVMSYLSKKYKIRVEGAVI